MTSLHQLLRASRSVVQPVILSTLFTLAGQSLHATPGDSTIIAGDTAQRIDRYLRSLVPGGFSGSLLVAVGGQVTLASGYGLADDASGLVMTPSTVISTGSITKQFTAAAIMKLVDSRKLSVIDTLGAFFRGVPPDKSGITIHQLLTHAAGFPGAIGDDLDPIGRDSLVALAMRTPLVFTPGARFSYSNVGYSLLAAIVEATSGLRYEQFLREQLLLPSGMRSTGYTLPDWSNESIACGYRNGTERAGFPHHERWRADGPGWHLLGNGGILSTPWEMYRWHLALEATTVLSASATAQLYLPHQPEGEDSPASYGYGWTIWPTPRQTTLISHNGGNGIFFADFLRYREEEVVIFFATNRHFDGAGRLAREIARMIFLPDHQPEQFAVRVDWQPEFPDNAAGDVAKHFLRLLNQADSASLRQIVEGLFSSGGLRDAMPLAQHLTMLSRIADDLKGHPVNGVLLVDRAMTIRFSNTPLRLRIEFNGDSPPRIAGLGVGD